MSFKLSTKKKIKNVLQVQLTLSSFHNLHTHTPMSLLKHPRVAVLSLSLYHNQSLQQVVCSTGMLLVAFLPRSGDSIYLNKWLSSD